MTQIRLFVIDPQHDFMDVAGAALPVPGASADMQRLAHFVDQHRGRIDDMVLTLDSHASVGIERTSFWSTGEGMAVAPFSAVTATEVRAGRYQPRDGGQLAAVLSYLDALEARSGRTLVVWPVHCVVGTWGHTIELALAQSIARWEFERLRLCEKVQKGLNPMTEQYSAFRAEVPRDDDARTNNNTALMARLAAGAQLLVVAGEALSHCVAASGQDMLQQMSPARLRNTVFLTDCMSPVPGFESAGQEFLGQLRAQGVRCMPVAELTAMIQS